MIHHCPDSKTFTLRTRNTAYLMQAKQGRLLHRFWGLCPDGGSISVPAEVEDFGAAWEPEQMSDEFLALGDTAWNEVALEIGFDGALAAVGQGDAADGRQIRDVRLRVVGHRISTDERPGLAPTHGQTARDERQVLVIDLKDEHFNFEVSLFYRVTPELDTIERWIELRNHCQGPITVDQCYFASLQLPTEAIEITCYDGGWAREFQVHRETLQGNGQRVLEQRGLNTGHGSNPFFILNRPGQAWEDHGQVWFGALAYSGNWRIALERTHTHRMRLFGGYNPFDFELVLKPGESHRTPAMITGCCNEGWGGVSRRMHRLAYQHILPQGPKLPTERPVIYNSWEATYFELSSKGQLALAEKAAKLGVELFVVDDGWFGSRRHEAAGLGDWTVSEVAFPDGLSPLIEGVKKLGMKFGLWVEPEMVNPDSDLYRAHPDWILHYPGRPRREIRNQLILDFGRPEVIDYIHGCLEALLRENDISCFKWDMNRYASEPGSVVGKAIWRRHVEGVYQLMDRLRTDHPELQIQTCAGGGARIDYGILARTDQAWTSDNTHSYDRIHIQEGYSYAYPPRCMESWVTHELNHQTGRKSDLSVRFDTAMRGALGIGTSIDELNDDELVEYAGYISFYKRIRHITHNGELYRLELLEEQGTSVWQYVLPDGSEAVYSVLVQTHRPGICRSPRALHGLNPEWTYDIHDRNKDLIMSTTGANLMCQGIPGDLRGNRTHSRTLHLVARKH